MATATIVVLLVISLQVIFAKDDEMSAFDKIFQVNNLANSKFSEAAALPVLFEGDIVRTRSLDIQISNMKYAAEKKISNFDAIKSGAWKGGVIPYIYDARFNSRGRQVVGQAIADYNKYTCIKWVPRTSERSYVTFFHGSGCYSMIGQTGGPQRISLATPGCLHKGIAIHEMMHCAGFFHEQSRLDRDSHIRIMWANIPTRVRYNFEKYRLGQASTLGAKYDTGSIMHYGSYAFSTNGQKTIVSLTRGRQLGQRQGFSKIDLQQLNSYYKCSGGKPTTPTSTCKDTFIFCSHVKSFCSHSFVLKNCLKTCNRCVTKTTPKPPPVCVDQHQNCGNWARQGYCTSSNKGYKAYMQLKCKKSCRLC